MLVSLYIKKHDNAHLRQDEKQDASLQPHKGPNHELAH